jgi:hypothetical protein
MDKIKVIITNGKTAAAPASGDNESLTASCPTLSKTQRMWGFAACFCLGYLISFGVRALPMKKGLWTPH